MNEELELLPINEQYEQKVLVELRKLKLFRNLTVEEFISGYNAGLIANINIVKDIAELIAASYKNISYHNKKLIVHSKEELAFENTITMLENWKLVSSLKRLALAVMNESYPSDTKLLFLESKPGVLHIEYSDNPETGEIRVEPFWQQEKLFTKQSDLETNMFLRTLIYDYKDNDKYVTLQDVIDIDDSFILDIYDMVREATFKGN